MPQCRICNSEYSAFIDFGKMPIANGFLAESEFESEYFFSMQAGFCTNCSMVQLLEQPPATMMFHDHYAFFSGTSAAMATHFQEFAEYIKTAFLSGKENPFVVEIGSNDGIMLRNFAGAGIRHLGIEPSDNVAAVAREKGVNTVTEFFHEDFARKIVAEYGYADAFLAANVMCHIDDFHSVVRGISVLLKPDGVAAFEDPYLGEVIRTTAYDQLYDEHVFLFSLSSISYVFGLYGMEVIDVQPQETHGGSMRFVVARRGVYPISAAVETLRREEAELGLEKAETYSVFRQHCELSRAGLTALLQKIKQEGKRVVGYAATSKSTTIFNYCGITPDLVEFISDTTPIKQGKYSPGVHIPVKPYSEFSANFPDYALLLAYNHKKEIMAKEQEFIKAGGKWILFVPDVHIE